MAHNDDDDEFIDNDEFIVGDVVARPLGMIIKCLEECTSA